MKNVTKNYPVLLLGAVVGTCLLATTTFGNPSMLPDHPGHPMKELKDPVSGQSLANDPGRELWTGQKALDASTQGENLRAPIQSRAAVSGENPNEVQNPQPKEQSQEQSK